VYCSHLCLAELFYVLARRRDLRFAQDSATALVNTEYLDIVSTTELDVKAGSYKCRRGISLADCYVLAIAKINDACATFARREIDLVKEIEREPLDVEVAFLEDYIR